MDRHPLWARTQGATGQQTALRIPVSEESACSNRAEIPAPLLPGDLCSSRQSNAGGAQGCRRAPQHPCSGPASRTQDVSQTGQSAPDSDPGDGDGNLVLARVCGRDSGKIVTALSVGTWSSLHGSIIPCG